MEELFRIVLNNIEDTILIYNSYGRVVYSNRLVSKEQVLSSKKEIVIGDKVYYMVSYSKDNDRIDMLTGVLTKKAFYEEINKINNAYNCVVIFGDIDNLKYYNEKYGHIETDKVIRGIGSILKQNIRQTDLIGRFGGDEFVILFKNTDLDSCYNRIDSIRKMICSGFYNLRCVDDDKIEKVKVSMTFGISFLQNDIDKCMKEADDALVNGKKTEKNKVYILGK